MFASGRPLRQTAWPTRKNGWRDGGVAAPYPLWLKLPLSMLGISTCRLAGQKVGGRPSLTRECPRGSRRRSAKRGTVCRTPGCFSVVGLKSVRARSNGKLVIGAACGRAPRASQSCLAACVWTEMHRLRSISESDSAIAADLAKQSQQISIGGLTQHNEALRSCFVRLEPKN
jgi:hypothetical protein